MQYGYARVSTVGQKDGNSLEEQENAIKNVYPDAKITVEAYTGKVVTRPEFSKLIAKLEPGDMLVVSKLDRFCRNTKEGLEIIDQLMSRDVKIHILNMGLIDTTPMGRFIVTCLLACAELERSQIVERTQGGKAIAKLDPNYKEGRPACTVEMVRLPGETVVDACKRLGVSRSTFYKYSSLN